MYSRLLQSPQQRHSFFLFGPRGTGKTMWLKRHFQDALYLDLLETELYSRLFAHPELLEELIPPDFDDWILIDEVQRIPALLNEVHRLIESRGYSFVLTGSSARTLRRKGVNLLAGRAYTYHMHPLTAVELGDRYDVAESLRFGQLPSVHDGGDPAHYLTAYIDTYLREEVLQEGLTRNLGSFRRFLEIASFSLGCPVNMSEVAREAALGRKLVYGYFALLEDLFLAHRVPVFQRDGGRRLVSHPKFYFFDAGVCKSPESVEQVALETLAFQELRAINDYLELDYGIYYWRTAHGVEVDFVLYGPKGLLAFEIKRKRELSPRDFHGLNAFKQDYPEATCYLLYQGKRPQYRGEVTAFPFQEAMSQLPQLLQS